MVMMLLFFILIAILLPGLMRFFFAMVVLFIIVTIAHAEPAGSNDVTITDRTRYANCTDSTQTKIVPARPPYYILLTCVDPHNAKVLPHCSAGGTSYCSMEDCEKSRLSFGHPWTARATSGFACAIVDEYGGTEIIRPMAQEPAAVPQPTTSTKPAECEPAFVRMNAELIHATVACNKNYMDTAIGVEIMELSSACYASLGEAKATIIARTAMEDWEKTAKEKGKKEACLETKNMFNAIKNAVAAATKN
jgi:hypothetical protein